MKLFPAVTSLLFIATAQAGTMTSSGTESRPLTSNNPWYVGEETVRYCIQADSSFSVNIRDASAQIMEAIEDWLMTLKSLRPETGLSDFAAGKARRWATRFKAVQCTANHELTFRLGLPSEAVKTALGSDLKFFAGLALRESFDDATGRTSGTVWLASDIGETRFQGATRVKKFWLEGSNLYNVLLHELGHVMGFPHTKNTVLDEAWPGEILSIEAQDPLAKRISDGIFALEAPQAGGGIPFDGMVRAKPYETLPETGQRFNSGFRASSKSLLRSNWFFQQNRTGESSFAYCAQLVSPFEPNSDLMRRLGLPAALPGGKNYACLSNSRAITRLTIEPFFWANPSIEIFNCNRNILSLKPKVLQSDGDRNKLLGHYLPHNGSFQIYETARIAEFDSRREVLGVSNISSRDVVVSVRTGTGAPTISLIEPGNTPASVYLQETNQVYSTSSELRSKECQH